MVPQLLRHLGAHSILELLLKLVAEAEEKESDGGAQMEWLHRCLILSFFLHALRRWTVCTGASILVYICYCISVTYCHICRIYPNVSVSLLILVDVSQYYSISVYILLAGKTSLASSSQS